MFLASVITGKIVKPYVGFPIPVIFNCVIPENISLCQFCLVAEKFLEAIEANPNYSLLLLHIVDNEGCSATVRQAAAITFKNFIKKHWRVVRMCNRNICFIPFIPFHAGVTAVSGV